MKVLVLFDSQYGNTEKIAKKIGSSFPSSDKVSILPVSRAHIPDVRAMDLLVVGSPTQGGLPTKELSSFLSSLSGHSLQGVKAAAFDTRFDEKKQRWPVRLLMKVIGYAAPRIDAKLREKGAEVVAHPEGFIVSGKEGPLKASELERAEQWVRAMR